VAEFSYHSREWKKIRAKRLAIAKRNSELCGICHKSIDYKSLRSIHIDHIVSPRQRTDLALVMTNLRPAHATCNTRRGAISGNKARAGKHTYDCPEHVALAWSDPSRSHSCPACPTVRIRAMEWQGRKTCFIGPTW